MIGIFHRNRSRSHAFLALAFLTTAGLMAGGVPGLIAGVGSFLFALLITAYIRQRIGGLTGDTLGATCELTELVPALVASAWLHGVGA